LVAHGSQEWVKVFDILKVSVMKPFLLLCKMKKQLWITVVLLSFSLALIIACNNTMETTKATIIERKCNRDSLLTITYQYSVKGKQYIDSIELGNKIIQKDTLSLFFSEQNPQKHTLQMP
jgi:hypothetical protein